MGAPSGLEFGAIIKRSKEIAKMDQNKKIKKYRLTCPKCDSSSFNRRYQLADGELNEHLKCICTICDYIWRMEPKEKEG